MSKNTQIFLKKRGSGIRDGSYKIVKLVNAAEVFIQPAGAKPESNRYTYFNVGAIVNHEELKQLCSNASYDVTITA